MQERKCVKSCRSLQHCNGVTRFKQVENQSRNYALRKRICCYSGFTFSHYDLPFPTRYCIPYVRSGLYQLVIRVKGIRVCALHCVRANDLDFAFLHWNLSAWSPRFERTAIRHSASAGYSIPLLHTLV